MSFSNNGLTLYMALPVNTEVLGSQLNSYLAKGPDLPIPSCKDAYGEVFMEGGKVYVSPTGAKPLSWYGKHAFVPPPPRFLSCGILKAI
jgi:hypothetical protein